MTFNFLSTIKPIFKFIYQIMISWPFSIHTIIASLIGLIARGDQIPSLENRFNNLMALYHTTHIYKMFVLTINCNSNFLKILKILNELFTNWILVTRVKIFHQTYTFDKPPLKMTYTFDIHSLRNKNFKFYFLFSILILWWYLGEIAQIACGFGKPLSSLNWWRLLWTAPYIQMNLSKNKRKFIEI